MNKNAKKKIVFAAVVLLLIPIIVVTIISIYKGKNPFFVEYNKTQLTAILAAFLSYIGTSTLGMLSFYQNLVQKQENELAQKRLEEINKNQLEEILYYNKLQTQSLIPVLSVFQIETPKSLYYGRMATGHLEISVSQIESRDFIGSEIMINNVNIESTDSVIYCFRLTNNSNAIINEVKIISISHLEPDGFNGDEFIAKGVEHKLEKHNLLFNEVLMQGDYIKICFTIFLEKPEYFKYMKDQPQLSIVLELKTVNDLVFYENIVIDEKDYRYHLSKNLNQLANECIRESKVVLYNN